MVTIACPDAKQSEAYIATAALFLIFGSSVKEEKVFLRLPAAWRDLWMELAESKKEKADAADRDAIHIYRDMVRQKRDQELEDGVLIQSAFKNRNSIRAPELKDESGSIRDIAAVLSSDVYQRIWMDKSGTPSYQSMLVRNAYNTLCERRLTKSFPASSHAIAYVGIQSGTTGSSRPATSCDYLR